MRKRRGRKVLKVISNQVITDKGEWFESKIQIGWKKTTSSSGRDDDNSQPKQKDNHFTIELEKGKKNKNLMNLIDFFFHRSCCFRENFSENKKVSQSFFLESFSRFFSWRFIKVQKKHLQVQLGRILLLKKSLIPVTRRCLYRRFWLSTILCIAQQPNWWYAWYYIYSRFSFFILDSLCATPKNI